MEEGLEEILESSCGLDVHKDKIEACILKTGAKAAYRETFGCISSELDRLCKWINDHGCKDIAMESTGVYWLPIYERIEAKCPDHQSLLVVNAYEIKSGLSRHKISQLMDAETWMNAKEAVKLGFADEILFAGKKEDETSDDGTEMLFSRKAVTDSLLSKLIPKRPEKPKNTVKVTDLEKRLSLLSH